MSKENNSAIQEKKDTWFLNRETSWLCFNARVLDEAGDARNPLIERLKFIAIFSNNLDEFFMVRVAGLLQQVEAGNELRDPAGNLPSEQVAIVLKKIKNLVKRQYRYLNTQILPALAEYGLKIIKIKDLEHVEREKLRIYFSKQVLPVLTPIAVDPSHPFPILGNGTIEIFTIIRNKRTNSPIKLFIEVPSILSRFIPVYSGSRTENHCFVLLEDLILDNLSMLIGEAKILTAFAFRITRDMDFDLNTEDASDLLRFLEKELRKRERRAPVRLEVSSDADASAVRWLSGMLGLTKNAVESVDGILQLRDMFSIINGDWPIEIVDQPLPHLLAFDFPHHKSMFECIREKKEVGLFLPYQSFDPLLRFLDEAANDPDVLAIKQTLYRVSGDSPIVHSLLRAAENGKQVTVIVELKARFDEENNISWARRLEESGAHVIYGIVGLKVHAKALMVIKREEGAIHRYVHLGTGNYNDKTARVYTDIGIFSCDPLLCQDIAGMFNVITGFSEPPNWQRISLAPFDLKDKFFRLIKREMEHSTPKNPGHIVAKMNSLVDPDIVKLLYQAAEKGVKIDLIVRGSCALNIALGHGRIRVISIIDRYLEHSRIYKFGNQGAPEYYLSSADWMPRNLHRRIELLFPVESSEICDILDHILNLQLNDTSKGRQMLPGGNYTNCFRKSEKNRSQQLTYEYFCKMNQMQKEQNQATMLQVIRGKEQDSKN